MRGSYIDVGIRVQALTLWELGMPIDEVSEYLGITKSAIYRFKRIAIARGYDTSKSFQIKLEYLVDALRSGRPSKVSDALIESIIETVSKNSVTRALTTAEIGAHIGVSSRTAHRILRK